jgi:hypothetical protein
MSERELMQIVYEIRDSSFLTIAAMKEALERLAAIKAQLDGKNARQADAVMRSLARAIAASQRPQ